MNGTKWKLMAATVGSGALLAMGGFSVATSSAEPDPAPPGPVTETANASIGSTSTEGPAPTAPEEQSFAPEITGPAPLPPEDVGVPG